MVAVPSSGIHLKPGSSVNSDGLACFAAATEVGCFHVPTVVGRTKPRELPDFRWINTMSQHHTWPGAVATCVVGGRVARGARRLGAATVTTLTVRAQHTGEAGFAGQVHAFVGQRRHDARWGHVRKARLVGHPGASAVDSVLAN